MSNFTWLIRYSYMTILFSLAGLYKKNPYLKFPNKCTPTPPLILNFTNQVSYFINIYNKQFVEVQVYEHVGHFSGQWGSNTL